MLQLRHYNIKKLLLHRIYLKKDISSWISLPYIRPERNWSLRSQEELLLTCFHSNCFLTGILGLVVVCLCWLFIAILPFLFLFLVLYDKETYKKILLNSFRKNNRRNACSNSSECKLNISYRIPKFINHKNNEWN